MDIRKPIKTVYGDWSQKYGALWTSQIEKLKQEFGSAIEEIRVPPQDRCDVPVIYIKKDKLVALMTYLKDHDDFRYRFLSDITATDEMNEGKSFRFETVYQLYSHQTFARIRVKCRLAENESVPSMVSLWPAANWAEREVFDMYGITFDGHPDLRRILMDVRFEGYPLRKDYPLRGYQIFTEPEPPEPSLLS